MLDNNVDLVLHAKMLIDRWEGKPVSRALDAVAGAKIVYAGVVGEAPEYPAARCLDLPDACLQRHRPFASEAHHARHARHARHEASRWSPRGGVLAVEASRWRPRGGGLAVEA